jgi:hypothetical protein
MKILKKLKLKENFIIKNKKKLPIIFTFIETTAKKFSKNNLNKKYFCFL